VYEVPVLDWKGRSEWIKARGVSYTTPSEQRDMPEGAREAFPEIAWSSVTVGQAAGPVDMIIGRDNPEWMPVPVQEEPYERFTLMWRSLSPRCILRDNEGICWRLEQQRGAAGSAVDRTGARSGECTALLKAEFLSNPRRTHSWAA
jgi:hypothetical protein